MKAQKQLADDYSAKNEALFNTTYNRDYLETNTASAMLERMRDRMQESNATIDKQAATTGATNENILAAKSKETEKYNEGAAQIAAQGTAAQDQAIGRYQPGAAKVLDMRNDAIGASLLGAQNQAKNSASTFKSILDAGVGLLGGGSGVLGGILGGVIPNAGSNKTVINNNVLGGGGANPNVPRPAELPMTKIANKPAFASASAPINTILNPTNSVNGSVLAPMPATTPISGAGLTPTGLMNEAFPNDFNMSALPGSMQIPSM